jgi:FKBP-type peptidyl-prolyl cis-trans isomerase FkpA
MKIFFSLTALSLGISLAACNQAPQEEATADNAQQAIATASSCPQADENGNIIIAPGLTATIIANGHGRAAAVQDYADVHTTLWLHDDAAEGGRGTEIWTSGGVKPFQFQIGRGQVIKGWDLGVPCMLVGETRELIISPGLGYGVAGKPPVPPNATLLFAIELLRLETP